METSRKYEDLHFLMEALDESKKSKIIQCGPKKVGAIVVKNGKIVGRGFRTTTILQENPYKDITHHAEHLAINEAGKNAKGATLYCTLEPCAARSILPGSWEPPPPCCELIVEAKIARVVIPKLDDFAGSGGAKYMMDRGINVVFFDTGTDAFEKLVSNIAWRGDVISMETEKIIKPAKP